MSFRKASLVQYLELYIKSLGGKDKVLELSSKNVATFITHGGRKFVIHKDFYRLNLTNVRGGYYVYDKDFVLQYSIPMSIDPVHQPLYLADGMAAVIPQLMFGLDLQDETLVNILNLGDYFYIGYEHYDEQRDMFYNVMDIVLMSPISVFEAKG